MNLNEIIETVNKKFNRDVWIKCREPFIYNIHSQVYDKIENSTRILIWRNIYEAIYIDLFPSILISHIKTENL